MPSIELTDEEHAALAAALRKLINEDRFPHAPRLDPLRSALAKLEAPPTPPRATQGAKPLLAANAPTTAAQHNLGLSPFPIEGVDDPIGLGLAARGLEPWEHLAQRQARP
jgi:hypothetical protein